jgi:hypothetical protein
LDRDTAASFANRATGDAVTVSITQQSPGVWNITIQNATNGGSYTGTVNYSSSLSSAEWTEEAPTSGNRVVLLDQFGTVQFTNLSASRTNRLSLWVPPEQWLSRCSIARA